MATGVCGYCGKHSHHSPVWGENIKAWVGRREADGAVYTAHAAVRCDNCNNLSVISGRVEHPNSLDSRTADAALAALGYPSWFPRSGDFPEIADVPEHITAAAVEAFTAASVGAIMASILMARTVIEATAKSQGITNGTLFSKIDALREANLIRPGIADAAHEIRHLGNDMAHGDISDAPTAADAEDVLALMMQVLSEVFQGPALVERIRQRRAPTTD